MAGRGLASVQVKVEAPYVAQGGGAVVRARGFLWGTTADTVRQFFAGCQVEGVHFVDPLHGECYVELASTGDLAPALEKHALRVGDSHRRRLIEVFVATFVEMKAALEHSEAREERGRRRGRRNKNRRRDSPPRRSRSRSRSSTRRSSKRSSSRRSSSRRRSSTRASSSRSSRQAWGCPRGLRSSTRWRRSRTGAGRSCTRVWRSSSRGRRSSSRIKRSSSGRRRSLSRIPRSRSSSRSRRSRSPASLRSLRDRFGRSMEEAREVEGAMEVEESREEVSKDEAGRLEVEIEGGLKTEQEEEEDSNSNSNDVTVELNMVKPEFNLEEVQAEEIQRKVEEIMKLSEALEVERMVTAQLEQRVKSLAKEKEAKNKLMARMKMNEMIIADMKKAEKDYKIKSEEVAKVENEAAESKAQVAALQESVNQLSVEKELMELKMRSLQQTNKEMKDKVMAGAKEEEVAELERFLESGRREIGRIQEEVAKLRTKGQADLVMLDLQAREIEELKKENEDLVKLKKIKCESGEEENLCADSLVKEMKLLREERDQLKKYWVMMKNENVAMKKDLIAPRVNIEKLKTEIVKKEAENEKVKRDNEALRKENTTLRTYSMHLDRCNNFLKSQNPVLRDDAAPLAVAVKLEPREPGE